MTYNDEFAAAETLRNKWKCRRAIRRYGKAYRLARTDEQRLKALHMMGVSYKMSGKLDKAHDSLRMALRYAKTSKEIGDVWRDAADVESLKDFHDVALGYIQEAHRHLQHEPAADAAAIGFEGRILQRAGNLRGALDKFQEADRKLEQLGTGDLRLFNLVPYINALSQAGDSKQYKVLIKVAERLCVDHGAWKHELELWALHRGGYRLHNLVLNAIKLRRFLP